MHHPELSPLLLLLRRSKEGSTQQREGSRGADLRPITELNLDNMQPPGSCFLGARDKCQQ